MTQYPDLFAALASPFDPNEVRVRSQAGRQLHYVTARTVMNRLDDIVGPENWWDHYEPHENSVKCVLTLRLPNGECLAKQDAGGYAGMQDSGDDDKSGYCLPLNAEALTLDGWREYHQLNVGEIILAYDPADGQCKWTSIRHITVFDEPCPTVQLSSKSFRMLCTPNHRWVVDRRDKGIIIKETRDLDTRDKIVNAAPAMGGGHPLTEREAAILGWLATDGSVVQGSRASEGRSDRQFHATIHQSKEPYRSQIRDLLGDDATENITPAGERSFPGHAVASLTRERSMFRLRSGFARELLAKAGISDWSDLIRLAPKLTVEARTAMFQAMLDGDGQHSCSGQLVFGKKCKPGVMEAFEILATLQGVSLGVPRFSTEGDLPIRTLRRLAHVHAKGIEITPARPIPVWCPTTAYGTWVTRWNGIITITGNSDAFKRAAAKFGVARYLYRDGVPSFVREREPALPHPEPDPPSQARPAPTDGQHSRDRNGHSQRPPSRDNAPKTGRALFAWLKEQEQRHEIGLIKWAQSWMKLQDIDARIVDIDAEQVAMVYAEAVRKLQSVNGDAHEEARAN